jgi:hypothetical protein
MKEVTDPALLAQLNGSSGGGKEVTDPALLAQLNDTARPVNPPQSMTGFVGGNLAKGAAQVAGIPAEIGKQLLSATEGPGRGRFEKLTKAPALPKSTQPMAGSQQHIEDLLKRNGIITQSAEPRGRGQEIAAAGLQALPSAVIPDGAMKALPRIASALGGGVGGEVGRQIGGTPGQLAGALVGGGLGGMAGAPRGIPKPPSELATQEKTTGIPLTIGQQTGSTTLKFIENNLRNLFPSAGTAREAELKQVTAAAKRVNDLADQISAPKGTPGELQQTTMGEQLRQAYKDAAEKISTARAKAADRDYGEVLKLAGDKPVISYKNTMATLDKIIAENENVPADTARSVVKQARQMKADLTAAKAGTPASPILGPNGQPLRGAAPPTTATHTIGDAVKTRSAWGSAARRTGNVFRDIDPNADQVLAKRLFGAINKDFDAASTASTPIAKALASANKNYANASKSLEFVENSALGKLIGKDLADAAGTGVQASDKAVENIAKKYLTMTPSQAKSVTAILTLHAPEVLRDAKAFVLRNGLEQAMVKDTGAISFAKFRDQMKAVEPKLRLMGFNSKEIKDIKDVTDVMRAAGDRVGTNVSGTGPTSHLMGTVGAAASGHLIPAAISTLTPYIASKALLTEQGRTLLRAAASATSGKAQAAAIGALRSTVAQPSDDRGQTNPPTTGTQLASPPQ